MEFHDTNEDNLPIPRYSRDDRFIELAEGISSIPEYYFEGYRNLTSIHFPHTLKHIGNYAFKDCIRLKMIYLHHGLLSIGVGCFSNCTSVTMVQIPNSVLDIKKEAFKRCESLVAVYLPNQLKSIEAYCFDQCKKLQRVILPSSIKCIRERAFYECSSLTEIQVYTKNIKICKESFKGCALKKVKFDWPSTNSSFCIEDIGGSAFGQCHKLVEVNLSSYPVYRLDDCCFEHCVSLRNVILSKKTKSLLECCFEECYSLDYIGYGCEESEYVESRYDLDLEHVQDFEDATFADCTSLRSIKLYNQGIRFNTFEGCVNLSIISLPGDMHHFEYNENCPHFVSREVVKLKVCSNINNISYVLAYYTMYEIISRNRILLEKCCTLDNLYPFEVAVGVLGLRQTNIKEQDDDWTIKVLYHYLREVPWILEKYLN